MNKKEIKEAIEEEISSQMYESGLTREEVIEPAFLSFVEYYLKGEYSRFDLQRIAAELGYEVDFSGLSFEKKARRDKTTNNLRSIRLRKGLTQEQLAEILNMTKAGVSHAEKSEMTASRAHKLAKILEVSPMELLGEDNFKIKPSSKEERNMLIEMLNKMQFSEEQQE